MTHQQRIALATSIGILSFIATSEVTTALEKQRQMNVSAKPSKSALDKPTFGEKFMMGLKKDNRAITHKRSGSKKR
jgi:hypothetical protein